MTRILRDGVHAEPRFHRGLLQSAHSSLLQIPLHLSNCFTRGEKVFFSHCLEHCMVKVVFQKGEFQPTFRRCSRIQPRGFGVMTQPAMFDLCDHSGL
jgi:hypothetical protein